jgi:hypothetical protein
MKERVICRIVPALDVLRVPNNGRRQPSLKRSMIAVRFSHDSAPSADRVTGKGWFQALATDSGIGQRGSACWPATTQGHPHGDERF